MKRYFIESGLDFQEVDADTFHDEDKWDPNFINNTCWVHEGGGGALFWTTSFANVDGGILKAFNKLHDRIEKQWRENPSFPALFLTPNERLPEEPWLVVTKELPIWMDHNFPTWREYASSYMVFGAVEEMGEVISAWFETDIPEMRKEAGDILVYLVALCVSNGWHIRDFILEGEEHPEDEDHPLNDGSSAVTYKCLLDVVRSLGVICRATLKMKQGIRGDEDHTKNLQGAIGLTIQRLEFWLDLWIVRQDYAAESNCAEILAERWAVVRQRDWQKDSEKGGQ